MAAYPTCQTFAAYPTCQSLAAYPSCQSLAAYPTCQSLAAYPTCQSLAAYPTSQRLAAYPTSQSLAAKNHLPRIGSITHLPKFGSLPHLPESGSPPHLPKFGSVPHLPKFGSLPHLLKVWQPTIKRLQRNNSRGPDDISNELFIEANEATKEILKAMIENVHKNKEIPPAWEGEIIRLYKGKGQKGKCSNERGIMLASNAGKVYERIINERVKKQITITKAQGGEKPGCAKTDHLIVLKQTIQEITEKKQTAYSIFLDVQKAYDKAWLDAIMYALLKNGVKEKNLRMIKKNQLKPHCENTNKIRPHKKYQHQR